MSDEIQIQRLTGSDSDMLLRLNTLFADAFEDRDAYLGAPPDAAYARQALGDTQVIALVALAGGDVVGGLVAYELQKLERARSEVYIYDLAVAGTHRRLGIATRLIEHTREIAHRRGAWVMYVQADYGDEPAINLYTKLGTREDVMHFDLPVDGA